MARKWEYSRGTIIVAVQNGAGDSWRISTLIARPGTPFSYKEDGKGKMYWARYAGNKRYYQYGITKKEDAEETARREAANMGVEYVPGIKEWDHVRTLVDGLIEDLKALGG